VNKYPWNVFLCIYMFNLLYQILGEAYQVLSDPVQRNAYNQNGKHSVSRYL